MDNFLKLSSPFVGVSTAKLSASLNRISLFIDNFRKIIRLTFKGSSLIIGTADSDNQRAKENLSLVGEPVKEEISLELKCADLQKILSSITDEEIYLYYSLKGMLRIGTQLGDFVVSLVSE